MRVPVVENVLKLNDEVAVLNREALREAGVFTIDLIGAHLTANDMARDAGTIGYEILTGLGPRLDRIYLGKRI